jgi:hypothetical protein
MEGKQVGRQGCFLNDIFGYLSCGLSGVFSVCFLVAGMSSGWSVVSSVERLGDAAFFACRAELDPVSHAARRVHVTVNALLPLVSRVSVRPWQRRHHSPW